MFFAPKILLGIAGVGGAGGASIGGIIYLTMSPNKDIGAFVESNKKAWRNYLVQVEQIGNRVSEEAKLSCISGQSCAVYKRDESHGTTSTKPNTIKVLDTKNIKKHDYYVLNIFGDNLPIDKIVEVEFPNFDDSFLLLKIISQVSIKTSSINLPQQPKKILPKNEWINGFDLDFTSFTEFPKLQNRHYRNQTYPTYIKRDKIDHKNYMVLKWQETTTENKLHINKSTMYYYPSDESIKVKEGWQAIFNEKLKAKEQNTSSPFTHPFINGDKLTKSLKKIDKDLVAVDAYLFKTFDQQKAEIDDWGQLAVKLSTDEVSIEGSEDTSSTDQQTKNLETFVEIYEIADQYNISWSVPSNKASEGLASSVNWAPIDKDNIMITKLSAMEHGKYYKFVFSNEKVIQEALKLRLDGVSAELQNKKIPTEMQTQSETASRKEDKSFQELLSFSASLEDFYCIRSQTTNKCSYFQESPQQEESQK